MKTLLKDLFTKSSLLKVLLPFAVLVTHIQTKPAWGYEWYEPSTLWSIVLVAIMVWLSFAILNHVAKMDNAWLNEFLLLDELDEE